MLVLVSSVYVRRTFSASGSVPLSGLEIVSLSVLGDSSCCGTSLR